MNTHEKLKQSAERAISELTSDRSVSVRQTLESLEELMGNLDDRIGGLRNDVRREEE